MKQIGQKAGGDEDGRNETGRGWIRVREGVGKRRGEKGRKSSERKWEMSSRSADGMARGRDGMGRLGRFMREGNMNVNTTLFRGWVVALDRNNQFIYKQMHLDSGNAHTHTHTSKNA